MARCLIFLVLGLLLVGSATQLTAQENLRPEPTIIQDYCLDCHTGEEAEARIDLASLLEQISTSGQSPLETDFAVWQSAAMLIADGIMPPADSESPSALEKKMFADWFAQELDALPARAGPGNVRRLAKHEYRNTVRSVFGFDLQVNIMQAEQTVMEKSLILKLLPTDPPGKSGFTNDTHNNALGDVTWNQYMYIAETAVRELFEPHRSTALAQLSELPEPVEISRTTAPIVLRKFLERARRRPLTDKQWESALSRLSDLDGAELKQKLSLEMRAELLSPRFLYRGTLHAPARRGGTRQVAIDEFELAERLSYFFWADMPDAELIQLAERRELRKQIVAQIDRMLQSPAARSLAEDFGVQWLGLADINLQVSNNPPVLEALRSQTTDFLHYLFTEDRPLLELIDSRVTFLNPHSSRFYPGEIRKRLPRYRKQTGIEVEIVPNSKLELPSDSQRGGILTMPGVLAMNRSPILRGTWVLERILGHELPEPPPNVPAIQAAAPDQAELTFRERFELHRAQPACAVCHDKIDPLGFAFDSFDAKGKLRPAGTPVGASGQLPNGVAFHSLPEFKRLLVSGERKTIVQNIVEKTLSYALCRELTVYDVKTVQQITEDMLNKNGTWRELFVAVAQSLPFQQVRLP